MKRKLSIFWGSILILLLFFSCADKKTARYLSDPKNGDVLLAKIVSSEGKTQYQFIKIFLVEENRIYFYQSPWSYHEKPSTMKRNDGFVARAYRFDREEFQKKVDQGLFIKVFRNYDRSKNSPFLKLFSQKEFPSE